MTILYRAIWQEPGHRAPDDALINFRNWVHGKSDGRLPPSGPESQRTPDGAQQLSGERAADLSGIALRSTFVECRDDGSRWTTNLRSWTEPGISWLWVDVEAVSHDSLEHVVVAAPRFVRELLNGGTATRRGIPITAAAQEFTGQAGAEELGHMVTAVDRDIPIAVFAEPPASLRYQDLSGEQVRGRFHDSARLAAEMVAGVAKVCWMDLDATRRFATILNEDYAVAPGAFRIYLQDVDPAVDAAWRHRCTPPARFLRSSRTAGKLISRSLSFVSGARRPPDSYESAVRLLGSRSSKNVAELQEAWEDAELKLDRERQRAVQLDEQYRNALEELEIMARENAGLREDLAESRKQLDLADPRLWEKRPADMAEIQNERLLEEAESPTGAVVLAAEHLQDFLVIPNEVCRDLDDLDAAVESNAWGNASWRAFRALYEYGRALSRRDDPPGSFWTWCENSRNPHAWPASTKKLAMSESIQVRTNNRLWAKRLFPVSTEVDPSGTVHMQAHIKIAEGGGVLAPRIYFHPSSTTGKVHVGYYGPHRNVPNTLT